MRTQHTKNIWYAVKVELRGKFKAEHILFILKKGINQSPNIMPHRTRKKKSKLITKLAEGWK